VRDDNEIMVCRQIGDQQGLGQSADAANVRLSDRNSPCRKQFPKFMAGRQPFARGNWDIDLVGENTVFVQIIAPDRCFDKVQVEFVPVLHDPRGGRRVGKHVLDVDHQRHVIADGFADFADQLGMFVIWFPHPVMGIGAVHRDFSLHGAKAKPLGTLCREAESVAVIFETESMGL